MAATVPPATKNTRRSIAPSVRRVGASVRVGALVSRFTVTGAAPRVALPNALATWKRDEALLSVSFTGEKVNVREGAPGMLVKTPAPALRCHWKDHGGAPVRI